jgi:hypothetical protein
MESGCPPGGTVKYIVHYQCSGRLFSTIPYESLELANMQADHLKESGFESVIVEAVMAHESTEATPW